MTHEEIGIRIGIHDATRLEWVALIPLPPHKKSLDFTVEFSAEVPAHLFAAQEHWRHLQVRSRLQSPLEQCSLETRGDLQGADLQGADDLRQLALAVAHRVKVLRQTFVRECFLANSLLAIEPNPRRFDSLTRSLALVLAELHGARGRLTELAVETNELRSERRLCDEFLSNQALDFLMHARRTIDEQLLRPGGKNTAAFAQFAHDFEAAIADDLSREVDYRHAQGFLTPTDSDPNALELFLERSSQLKKHFHELLFLRDKSDQLDSRLRSWGGIIGCMGASFFAFGFNAGLLNGSFAGSLGTAGFSLGMIAFLGAVVYAVQDRIKEAGRNYFSQKLGRFYAQRLTRLFAPERLVGEPDEVAAKIKESLIARPATRPDPLNPDLASREVMLVHYKAEGATLAQPAVRRRGIRSIKQIYRYDLSWLLARLDDPMKRVPVIGKGGGLSVSEAPRCYRLPVTVKLTTVFGSFEERVVAVVHKRGLERFEALGGQDLLPQALVPALGSRLESMA